MPHEWQFPDKLEFLFQPARYKVAHGGRGGAKSWGFARALLIRGWQRKRRVLCAREVQKSIKDSVHKLLSDQIEALGLSGHYAVLNTEIKGANGTEFIFSGLSNLTAESIKSFEGIDDCWVEEAQGVSRRSWDLLVPTIRKDGSEIWVSLNPELDTDETFTRFVDDPPPTAKVVEINWRDNPFLPETLKAERLEFLRLVSLGKRTQDDYDNIWEGKCRATVEGAIYHHEIMAARAAKRLCHVPHDPLLKVHTVWDLGWADHMSILLVQRAASEIRVIGYIEDTHRTYADYVQQLEAHKGCRWGKDFIPHDGRAKSPESGRSPEMILTDLGRKVEIVEDIGLENGIKAVRQMFPRVWFDRTNAGGLFNRLGRYKRAINQTTNQPGAPLHDENSHGADGFRYLAVVEPHLANDDGPDLGDYYADLRRSA